MKVCTVFEILLVCTFASVDGLSQHIVQYDQQGRIVSDNANNISLVEWNEFNKVSRVVSKHAEVEFSYDFRGNRVRKLVKPKENNVLLAPSLWSYTYYQYDARGTEMAHYSRVFSKNNENKFTDELQRPTYILEKGLHSAKSDFLAKATFTATQGTSFENIKYTGLLVRTPQDAEHRRGDKQYELTNHINSITNVITDRITHERASEIVYAQDYYAYGMSMPGRIHHQEKYQYGFVGKETDTELAGSHNNYDFGARFYDPRLARWWSMDAKASTYPQLTPYNYAANSPIRLFDPDGNDITWLDGSGENENRNSIRMVSGNEYEYQRRINDRIQTAKDLLMKCSTSKIVNEANNNPNIQVFIAFNDHPSKYEGTTVKVEKSDVSGTTDGTTTKFKLNESLAQRASLPHIKGLDVTKQVNEETTIYVIMVKIYDYVNKDVSPAFHVAVILAHEIEAHVNIPERYNNYYYGTPYAAFFPILDQSQMHHVIYGSHQVGPTEIRVDKKGNYLYKPFAIKGSPAEKIFFELYKNDQSYHDEQKNKASDSKTKKATKK